MIQFKWCRYGCNTYHDLRAWPAAHTLMVVISEREPDEHNFPGTPEELERFKAQRVVAASDRLEADRLFEARVDAVLEGRAPEAVETT